MSEVYEAAPPLAEITEDWQRLDRRTIFVAPLMPMLSVLGAVALIVVVRGWAKVSFWEPAITGGIAVALFIHSAWRWKTTRYRVTDTHVEMHSGVVTRKRRSVTRDRVRAVDISANVFHRVFGISVVTVGTGRHVSDAGDEIKLDSVSTVEVEHLRRMLMRRTTSGPLVQDGRLTKFTTEWLRYAPLTVIGFVAVLVAVGGLTQLGRTVGIKLWDTKFSHTIYDWYAREPLPLTILVTAAIVLVLSMILSVAVYAVIYWGFELTRRDGALHVQYGLLTKRSVAIEERRLRGVKVDEPLLLRAVGGAKVTAVATGLGKKKGEDEKWEVDANLLLPQAPHGEANRVVAEVLRVRPAPTEATLVKHPRAAARRLIMWSTLIFAVPAIVMGVLSAVDLTPDWIWEVLLVLVPVGVLYGIGEYHGLGHTLSGDFLVCREGVTPRVTVAVQRTGIVGWKIRQSFFQRRLRLITVGATVAAGSGAYYVRNANQDDGLSVADVAVPDLLAPFLERY
ncbi:PH domain-containing protein [Actinocrispum wychmicini]|uniref:Putative membrane protein n=1 Tax=Actinocrispum wychmicini TaxID=1213861 RepID=A0A4R2JFK1_9PSEU|nr:PH domain-containing protein [Actinocrispum wychmicini]TCO58523.1 putative membrane protein [Actinocrispum wychmicini]